MKIAIVMLSTTLLFSPLQSAAAPSDASSSSALLLQNLIAAKTVLEEVTSGISLTDPWDDNQAPCPLKTATQLIIDMPKEEVYATCDTFLQDDNAQHKAVFKMFSSYTARYANGLEACDIISTYELLRMLDTMK